MPTTLFTRRATPSTFANTTTTDLIRTIWRRIPPYKLLDVGSATGITIELFEKLGVEAWGIENSAYIYARTLPQWRHRNLFGDVRALPFEDNSFDFVYETCLCYLPEHDLDKAISELFRVVRTGLLFGSITSDMTREVIEQHELFHGVQTLMTTWEWSEQFLKNGFRMAIQDSKVLKKAWRIESSSNQGDYPWYPDMNALRGCFFTKPPWQGRTTPRRVKPAGGIPCHCGLASGASRLNTIGSMYGLVASPAWIAPRSVNIPRQAGWAHCQRATKSLGRKEAAGDVLALPEPLGLGRWNPTRQHARLWSRPPVESGTGTPVLGTPVSVHGRIFKLMGDGLLAEFSSVVDAVECAVMLQRGIPPIEVFGLVGLVNFLILLVRKQVIEFVLPTQRDQFLNPADIGNMKSRQREASVCPAPLIPALTRCGGLWKPIQHPAGLPSQRDGAQINWLVPRACQPLLSPLLLLS